jgi:membrane associated rhomboid family serine protease
LFCDLYLRVREHRQRLSKVVRAVAGFCILFAIAAALGVFVDARILRRLTPIVGISSLMLGVIVALTMTRYEARRVLLFLLCWSLGLRPVSCGWRMTSFPRWAPTLTRSTRHTSRRVSVS